MNTKNPLLKVTTPSKELRRKSREALKGGWFKAMLLMIVWGIFAGVISAGASFISSIISGMAASSGINSAIEGGSMATGAGFIGIIIVLLVYVAAFILSSAFTLGISTYFLKIAKEKQASIGDLFAAFREGAVFRSAGLAFVQSIFIFLWSLLFVIPGIIAAFRYSQAFYVLAEMPHKSISACMNKSKELMSVNKSKLFWLDLSFIGWWLLSGIAGIAVMVILFLIFAKDSIMLISQLAGSEVTPETMAYIAPQILSIITALGIGGLISALLYLPVQVYSAAANAVFYRVAQAKRAQAVRTAAETELLLAAEDEKLLAEDSKSGEFSWNEDDFDEENIDY